MNARESAIGREREREGRRRQQFCLLNLNPSSALILYHVYKGKRTLLATLANHHYHHHHHQQSASLRLLPPPPPFTFPTIEQSTIVHL